MNREKPRSVWPILSGLLAGAIGAVVASLVSLPLRSPDDLIGNTASVTIVALLLGLATGVVWRRFHDEDDSRRKLLIFAGGGFLLAVVVLILLEIAALDRFISFGVPLAAIIFAALGFLTPRFTDMSMPQWTPLVGIVVALVVGGALVSFGDAESGDLSLDDLPTVTNAPSATGTSPTTTAGSENVVTPSNPSSAGVLSIPDDLSSTTFSFGTGTATWAVPETFTSGGLEATAVGRSEQLSGRVVFDGESEFTVDLTTFVSDQDRRDSRVRSLFASAPIARFATTGLDLPTSYTEGEIFATEVTGDMTINGVTRSVTWMIEARLVDNQLDVAGALDIVLTDFDVEPPSNTSVTVRDEARLEILFSAIGE